MSYWWLFYGKFAPEPDGLYSQTRQVVTHYRERAGLSREQLAPRLGIGAKALYYAEYESRGLDAITRRRQLCAILRIPPALLGLCEAP
ncbi:MAG: helix-turn-helix domain-containing protein, partial [Ktedonobacteraceae bacterium]